MRIYTSCHSCKAEISFISDINDRVQLEMKKGKVFDMTCDSCYKKIGIMLMIFSAEKSMVQKITAISVPVIITLVILYAEFYLMSFGILFYGGIFLLPSVAYMIVHRQQQTQLNAFNRYKVKE